MDGDGRDLQVALRVVQPVWTLGTTVEVEAVLTNVSQLPLRVDTFGALNMAYEGKKKPTVLASCWALTLDGLTPSPGPKQERAPLDASQFVLLQPGQSYTARLSLPLQDIPPGRYQAKLVYSPRVASSSFSFPEHWLRQQGITEPIWVGWIVSTPVAVDVR